jgi:predicted  nucleic acid-binding Zn-ribbon protein
MIYKSTAIESDIDLNHRYKKLEAENESLRLAKDNLRTDYAITKEKLDEAVKVIKKFMDDDKDQYDKAREFLSSLNDNKSELSQMIYK